jgi:hypothetical protein
MYFLIFIFFYICLLCRKRFEKKQVLFSEKKEASTFFSEKKEASTF